MRIPYLSTLQTTKCLAIHLHPPPPKKKLLLLWARCYFGLWLLDGCQIQDFFQALESSGHKKKRAREKETREGRESVSPSRAPVLSFAHYFQAPAMHATNFLSSSLENWQWIFLASQSWLVLKSWYTGGGPEQGFRRCFTEGLNHSLVSSLQQAKITLSPCIW